MSDIHSPTEDSSMRDWRREASLWAWMLALGVGIMAAALAVVIAEAFLQQLPTARGVWAAVPFFGAAVIVVISIFFMLRSGFGWGAICGSMFRVPPASLVGVFAVLAFWLWLWRTGPRPWAPSHSVLAPVAREHEAIFMHGWIWLWGAVVSCGIALLVWHAVLPRMMARYGTRLLAAGELGITLEPLPADDASPRAAAIMREGPEILKALRLGGREAPGTVASAAPSNASAQDNTDSSTGVSDKASPEQPVTSDVEMDYWLQGNDQPIKAGEKSLFVTEPSPQRIIASLRPTHLYGTARTLALIGQRGAGKSSLLRLAEGSPEAKNEVELRFVYVSLWEYKTAQAAIESMIEKVLHKVRDKVDIFPFTGAAGAFIRAITGDGRFQWIADTLALRVSSEDVLGALSTVLLLNKLRIIICIEDNDRLEDASLKSQFVGLITGAMDFIRQFPGFGYVICVSSSDWNALYQKALDSEEPAKARNDRYSQIISILKPAWQAGQGDASAAGNSGIHAANSEGGEPQPPVEGDSLADAHADTSACENRIKQQILVDIRIQRRAAETAANELLDGFDTPRLCREDLIIPPLAPEQWVPMLENIRRRMYRLVNMDADADCFGLTSHYADGQQNARHLYAEGRQLIWGKLIRTLSSSPHSLGRIAPEFGLANTGESGFSFTPRALRRGLGEAWRKWRAINPRPDEYIRIIDPDSVLVACMVRACRPDVWNILIRDERLLPGGDWPSTDYLVQAAINRRYTNGMVRALPLDKDQPGYGEAFPHLGLIQEIINVMRKSCRVSDCSGVSVVAATSVSGPVEEPFLQAGSLANTRLNVPKVEVIRPGGLIGALLNESHAGSNWRLFLNA